jgi:hypothetical protein
MLGGILSVLIVLIRYFTKKSTPTNLSNDSLSDNKSEFDTSQATEVSHKNQALGKQEYI